MGPFSNEAQTTLEKIIDLIIDNPILVTLLILLIIIILREIRCWYWKIDERIENQREIERLMQAMTDYQKEQIKLMENIIAKIESNETKKTKENTIDS